MKHYLTKTITYNSRTMTDLFKRIKVIDDYKLDTQYYNTYWIQDGETPELLSYKFYGTTDYWWTILLFNDIYDPFFDWPLSDESIRTLTLKLISDDSEYTEKYDELVAENDAKKEIKILKKGAILKIIRTLQGI